MAFSPTDSPPVVLLVSWGQRRGGGAITRSTETVEDVALPPPFGARGWLARRLALAILWMSSLGKEGNQHWYLTRWRKCFCVEIELEFEVLCVVCSKCGNSNVSNQLRVLLVNKEKWNLLLRLYFSATNYFIFIAKPDLPIPLLSRKINSLRGCGDLGINWTFKKLSPHAFTPVFLVNSIWLRSGGTVAFPDAIVILCVLNPVRSEWHGLKEHK